MALGWTAELALGPSALFGANGLHFGPDGQLYVAQAFGSQVSRIDPATGTVGLVSRQDGALVAPDDLAFDSQGVMYATEVFSGRVSARARDGGVRVLAGDLPVVNGITVHQERIFVDEFRVGGRVLELYRDGRAPRVIAQDQVLPNALTAGPDGYLYFPLVVNGEVARVPIDGGAVEVFISGLDLPTAVKFDPQGRLIVVQSGSGEVTRYELPSRLATRVARVRPGIDNLAFSASGELFVSHFTDGGIDRIGADGSEQALVRAGILGPYGLAEAPDGRLFFADGMSYGVLSPDGTIERPSMLLRHGFPGYVCGIAVAADGTLYLGNSAGGIASFVPGQEADFLATELDQVMGLAVAPDGSVLACEAGGGRLLSIRKGAEPRVLASGLKQPTAVAVAGDGSYLISEAGSGRVLHWQHGSLTTMKSGLVQPHGIAVQGDAVYVVDRADKSLHALSLASGKSSVVAHGLPVGTAAGVVPHVLPGIPGIMPGPLLSFTGLTATRDGGLALSGDADGSLLRLRPTS